MPRLAIIADIHGNMPALEAVLRDIENQAIDELLVAGDLVGRGPQGSRVVQRIRQLGCAALRGNHEDYLLDFRRGEIPDDWLSTEEWAAARFMAAELSEQDSEYIAALPLELIRPALRVVHGTPRSNRDGIGPWTDDHELHGHLQSIPEPLLVCAHTHRPLIRDTPAGRVVNVGSVGLPFNRDPRAQYAILEQDGDSWQIEPRQVPYELGEILAIYSSSGFLEQGGITAQLLRLELQNATPLLVPFLEWCKVVKLTPALEHLDAFLDFHDPDEPLRELFRRLRELAEAT